MTAFTALPVGGMATLLQSMFRGVGDWLLIIACVRAMSSWSFPGRQGFGDVACESAANGTAKRTVAAIRCALICTP